MSIILDEIYVIVVGFLGSFLVLITTLLFINENEFEEMKEKKSYICFLKQSIFNEIVKCTENDLKYLEYDEKCIEDGVRKFLCFCLLCIVFIFLTMLFFVMFITFISEINVGTSEITMSWYVVTLVFFSSFIMAELKWCALVFNLINSRHILNSIKKL